MDIITQKLPTLSPKKEIIPLVRRPNIRQNANSALRVALGVGVYPILINPDTVVSFPPVDDLQFADEGGEEHEKRCATRMDKLRNFVHPAAFTRNIPPCCVSSMPRWEFARGIQTSKKQQKAPTFTSALWRGCIGC